MRFLPPLLLLVALATPTPASAGAWTKSWGEYYTKLGADYYKAVRYVDPTTGEELEGLDFFGQQYSLYAEFGLLPWWPLQVSAQLPLTVGTLTFEDETNFAEGDQGRATSTRLGDLRVTLQTSILRNGFQLAPAFELKLPLYANGRVGSAFGTWKEAFPLPGDGQVDLTGWLLLGGPLPGTPIFIQGGAGYRHRTEAFVGWEPDLQFVDGLPFTFTLGVGGGPFLGMLQVDGVKNFVEDDVTKQYLSVGGAVFVTVHKGLAIEGRVAGDVWADNTAQGVSFGVGISWRMPYPGYDPEASAKAGDADAESSDADAG